MANWFHPTGYEHKKLSPRYPPFARPREPNFRRRFERVSDPQIPLTRLKIKGPGWVTGAMHSEIGGGRGLAARDAVCIDFNVSF
jgi:hypothetical protein